MSEFTASNGIKLRQSINGGLNIENATEGWTTICGIDVVTALREFFQKEKDDRFDRWRWPANPEYVVYAWTADPARTARGVTVLSESIPRGYTVWEDNIDTLYGTSENEEARVLARKAARAWFDAHPEPKPAWHDAKPGEVWVITTRNVGDEVAVRVALVNEVLIFEYITSPTTHLSITSDRIESGRRLWPEVAS